MTVGGIDIGDCKSQPKHFIGVHCCEKCVCCMIGWWLLLANACLHM